MIVLQATTQKLEAVLAGAVATTQPVVTAVFTWRFPQDTTVEYRRNHKVSSLNNTTDVEIVEAPAVHNLLVYVESITVYNKDTANVTVTVKMDDNGTETELKRRVLSPGQSLIYEHGVGWQEPADEAPFIDSTAIVKGSEDSTKLLRFEVDGLTTGTTRVATMPDANIKLAGHATGGTANRIPVFTGATGGVLTDFSSLTYDGTTFTAGGTGGISVTAGNASVSRSNAGGDVAASITNTDNTNAASHSANEIFSGGASGGDPKTRWSVTGVLSYVAGIDNSDSDKWKLSHGTALGTNDIIRSDTSGNVEMPTTLQVGTGDASRGWKVLRKTADESVTSSTTLQDDNHLTFTIAANEEWVADFFITCGAALTTTGAKLAVTVPSGASMDFHLSGLTAVLAGTTNRTTSSGTGLSITTAMFQQSDFGLLLVHLWVLNGANAGSVTLQWAQDSSSASALTFRKGSSMTAHRVA